MKKIDISAPFTPSPGDFQDLSDKLSEFTRQKGAPEYNPLSVAFRAVSSLGAPLGEVIATQLWGRMEVNLLHVEPGHRREGVGRRLMSAVEEYAKAAGCVGVHLWTPTWQGEGFYPKIGYAMCARLPLSEPGACNILFAKELRHPQV